MSLAYIELEFKTGKNKRMQDILTAELGEVGFESFMDSPSGFLAYIPERDFDRNQLAMVLSSLGGVVEYAETLIPPQNWNLEWEKQFDPVWITDRCVIRAPFHEPVGKDIIELIIEPKMSFGTGHHPTTRLMSKALFLTPPVGKRVLDMGCGTGILAILASKLGASSVYGIDIEQWAIENSIENAARNNVSARFFLGGSEQIKPEKVDVLLANINRNVLIDHCAAFSTTVVQSGFIFLSGFLEPDVEPITQAYGMQGFRLIEKMEEESWRCLVLLKG